MTEGRAAQPLETDDAKAILNLFKQMVPEKLKNKLVCQFSASVEDRAALKKVLGAQAFGFAAGHISNCRCETGQVSCWRWSMKGTREMALVSTMSVAGHLKSKNPGVVSYQDCVNWIGAAQLSDFVELMQSDNSAVRFATIGPRDLLFTPAGVVTFHKIFQDSDVLGVRWSSLCPIDKLILPSIRDELKKRNAVQDSMAQACEILEAAFQEKTDPPSSGNLQPIESGQPQPPNHGQSLDGNSGQPAPAEPAGAAEGGAPAE